jgi:hypothetical protein
MRVAALVAVAGLAVAGCSSQNPARPDTGASTAQTTSSGAPSAGGSITSTPSGKPGYEPAYYNETTVTINAIEVPQNTGPLTNATADFYEVVYPSDHALWPSNPQCNPCDHDGNGIDMQDFHDHVLDSIPSNPGHGEYAPLWRVWAVVPLPGKDAAYAALLPINSEAKIDAAVAAGLATKIDTGFYFICAVVSPNAAK